MLFESVFCKHAEDKTIDYVFALLDIPWWYYLISLGIGSAIWFIWKRPSLGLLAGYSILVLAETVLIRNPFVGEHLKLELFWSWRAWDVQSGQIIANVVMFIPIGLLSGWFWKWKGAFVAVGMSVLIELLQLVSKTGLCEIDDVIHNSLGAVIGIVAVLLLKKLFLKEKCE